METYLCPLSIPVICIHKKQSVCYHIVSMQFNILIFNVTFFSKGIYNEVSEFLSLLSGSIDREHILNFLRVDYASVGECEFPVLECPAVARPYEVTDTLTVFQMSVQVGLKPVYALCHSAVRCEVPDIYHTISAFHEETEDKGFYLFV